MAAIGEQQLTIQYEPACLGPVEVRVFELMHRQLEVVLEIELGQEHRGVELRVSPGHRLEVEQPQTLAVIEPLLGVRITVDGPWLARARTCVAGAERVEEGPDRGGQRRHTPRQVLADAD